MGIFDRLEQTKKRSSIQPQIKVTGLNSVPSKSSSSSIFSRLGGKSDDHIHIFSYIFLIFFQNSHIISFFLVTLGKSDDIEMDEARAIAFAGILKSAPKKVCFSFHPNYLSLHKSKMEQK